MPLFRRATGAMKKNTRFAVLAMSLLLYAGASPAFTPPAPFTADFTGARFPLSAKARISLSRTGDFYRYTLTGSVHAAFYKWTEIYDCSVLQLRGNELYPLEYVHRDSRNSRRNVHTRFDWARKSAQITLGDGSEREINDLPQPVWDVMSIQVRMRADVPGAAPGTSFDYTVLERGKIAHRRVTVDGAESVRTDTHDLQATGVRLEGVKGAGTFWFAKDYAWLPVRISMNDVTLDLASRPEQAMQPAAPPGAARPGC